MADDLAGRTRALLDSLARDGFGGRYHLPEPLPEGEELLSTWSSAHQALALAAFDAKEAAEELRTLYRACQTESGLVARMRRVADDEAPAAFIQPPVAAFAAGRLASDVGTDVRDLLEAATRELDAIWGERLPPDTDLPVILHPWESATPESPLYDDLVDAGDDDYEDELASLARSAMACGLAPDRALRAGHAFVVEDPIFCGWFLLALEQVRDAWEAFGGGPHAQKLAIRSRMIAESIAERLWWDSEEIFVALDRGRDDQLQRVCAGGLVPAASALLLEDGRARKAVARYLAPGGSPLWGAHALSFNPIVRDRSEPRPSAWRGNSASAPVQLWAHLALLRSGRTADARVARTQLESLIEAEGFREFYDPLSGEGRGATDVALPAIVVGMARAEEGAQG